MVLASAKNFETLVAVRFLVGAYYHILWHCFAHQIIGLAESTFYPAIQYVIGSWYKGDELGKRACIFHVSVVKSFRLSICAELAVIDRKCSRTNVQRLPSDGT